MATIVNLITYSTKSEGGVGSAGQWLDSDANQVKSIVNLKADNSALTSLEDTVATNITSIAVLDDAVALKANSDVDSSNEAIRTRSNHIGGQDASTITSGLLDAGRIPQGAVTQYQSLLSINKSQITGLSGSIVDSSRKINTGSGLTGGGDLTADRTISIESSGVTPGSYTSANITVGSDGRITSASNGESSSGDTVQGISYTQNIVGDGSTTQFDLTHNQNITSFIFSVFETSTGEAIIADMKAVSTSTARVTFSSAPANGKQYRVTLMFSGAAQDVGSGVTAHTHSLSEITDVTASATEVNVLDGITATTTEINYTDGVTSPIQTQLDNKAPLDHYHSTTIINETTTSRTIGSNELTALGVGNVFLRTTNASPTTITVPPNSTTAFVVGSVVNVQQQGSGQCEFIAGSGVTFEGKFNGSSEYKISARYGAVSLIKVATDTWAIIGDLETT